MHVRQRRAIVALHVGMFGVRVFWFEDNYMQANPFNFELHNLGVAFYNVYCNYYYIVGLLSTKLASLYRL